MKVCLYLEAKWLVAQSGIGSALKQQALCLSKVGVKTTEDPGDDYDILHLNTIGPYSFYLAQKAKAQGKKVIMHAHTLMEDTKNSFTLTNQAAGVLREYLSFYYSQADAVFCPSEYAKKLLETEYGIKNPVYALSNGYKDNKFKFSKEARKKYREKYEFNDFTCFGIGHVFVRKGVPTFVRMARKFKSPFVWYGRVYPEWLVSSSQIRDALDNPPKNMRFLGYVDDILAAYCSGDLFFFPTNAETQGIVILEAMACERPVLIRDIPVFDDWLTHGKDCLKAKNEKELHDYIITLKEDEKLRAKLVRNGKKTIKAHTLDNVGKNFKKAYEEILSTK